MSPSYAETSALLFDEPKAICFGSLNGIDPFQLSDRRCKLERATWNNQIFIYNFWIIQNTNTILIQQMASTSFAIWWYRVWGQPRSQGLSSSRQKQSLLAGRRETLWFVCIGLASVLVCFVLEQFTLRLVYTYDASISTRVFTHAISTSKRAQCL